MSSRGKRSSILKKRPSVPGPGSLEASLTETSGGTVKVTKRIGFKAKKSVKEFFATDETMTVWCNSYEVSADGTPPHLTINDTTLKDVSKGNVSHLAPGDQKNKENISSAEEHRNSPNNSSVWNLSISTCEDEKRRMKAEVSVNSSVLNSTERLAQEPLLQTKGALRQKRQGQVVSTSAMDVSPAKCEGKLSSPRKTIYYHPQQNMFITIDDVVPNFLSDGQMADGRKSPNETDINFYGPVERSIAAVQGSANDAAPAKILFQTSNVLNPYRNKSIQTEPRPSMVDKRSIAVNADLSAGWSSHIAGAETFAQRYTFGNSQFDISEAWNSHPAAALKLKMLQQGLISQEFDPRLSDGGGGLDDIDSTIAITQTVAKMLGPGSRPVSLESTRLSVPEMMESTKVKLTQPDDAMDTSMQIEDEVHPKPATLTVNNVDTLLEQSLNESGVPINALSRARPSFVPTVVPMDQSECPSPEVIVSISGQRHKSKKRETTLKTVPIDTTSLQTVEQTLLNASEMHLDASLLSIPSPVKSPPVESRRTILNEEQICADDHLLTVVKAATVTPPRPPRPSIRQTVYDGNMEETHVELVVQEEKRSPRIQMEAINMDLADLIFGKNSIGLELIKNSEVQQNMNRPKIHRMPPRMLGMDFGVTSSARKDPAPAKNAVINEVTQEVICLDSPESAPKTNIPRKTVNVASDVSLEIDPLNMSDDSEKQKRQTIYPRGAIEQSPVEQKEVAQSARRTNFQSLDVSMESPVERSLSSDTRRPTIFTSENLDETVPEPVKTKLLRPTMLFNEKLDHSKLQPRSGSLEDLRKYGQLRKSIVADEAMEFSHIESPRENNSKPTRKTEFQLDEMEQSRLAQDDGNLHKQKGNKSRLTTIGGQCLDETAIPASSTEPASVGCKHRETICFDSEMNQTGCYSRFVSVPVTDTKSRQTVLGRESMEQSLIENTSEVPIAMQQLSQRVTIYSDENMDQTRNDLRPQSPQTVTKEICDTGQMKRPLTPEIAKEPVFQKSRQTSYRETLMNETVPLHHDEKHDVIKNSRKSFVPRETHKSRQTSFAVENMDQTLNSASGIIHEDDVNPSVQQSKASVFREEDMEETTAGGLRSSRFGNEHSLQQESLEDDGKTGEYSKPLNVFQKSCQTSFAIQIVNEDLNEKKSVTEHFSNNDSLQKTCHTAFQDVNMDQTEAMRATTPTLSDLKNSSTNENVRKSPLQYGTDKLKAAYSLHNSRETCFTVENMEQTMATGCHKSPISNIDHTLSHLSTFQQADMEQTSKDKTLSPIHMSYPHQHTSDCSVEKKHFALHDRLMHNSRHTSHQREEMDQTIPTRRSPSLHQRTALLPTEKSRQTVHSALEMDETLPFIQSIPDPATLVESPRSRHTVYAATEMDQTSNHRSPILTVPQSPASDIIQQKTHESPERFRHAENKRSTVYTREDMDETRRSKSPLAYFTSSLHQTGGLTCIVAPKVRHTIFHQDPMEETTVAVQQYCVLEKSRNTLSAVADMNETISEPRTSPDCVRRSNGMNKDISMKVYDEMVSTKTTVPVPGYSESNHLDGTKSRRTVYCEEDMEQTTAGLPLRLVTAMTDYDEAEKDFDSVSHGKSRIRLEKSEAHLLDHAEDYFPQATTKAGPSQLESEVKYNRQTILVAQDMEESVVNAMAVSVIKSPPKTPTNFQQSRRTIVYPANIAEESIKRDIKLEQTGAMWNDEISLEIKPEESKTDFSFTIPQLPEDFVLRSTAIMPNRMTNFSNHTVKPVFQPFPTEDSTATDLLLGSRRTTEVVRVPVDELSEISGMGDLTRLTRPTSFAVQGDVSSVLLKELTEPTIVQPAVPVTVIQETPKKSSMIPMRSSRGTIFDRQPMDLDESGISLMVCEEKVELLPVVNHVADHTKEIGVKNTTLIPTESMSTVRPAKPPEHDSSDDEFYDAEVNQDGAQNDENEEDVVYIAREATALNRNVAGRGNLKFIEIDPLELSNLQVQNQTLGGHKTLKFIDINELEQTTNQKRHLSQISKSVLQEQAHDPLNISITEDYPLKKRKTTGLTPSKAVDDSFEIMEETRKEERKSVRRVTFHQDLMLSVNSGESIRPSESVVQLSDVEAVMIKKECSTISEDEYESEQNKMGQTILTDPSVFIVEDNDMLANESNISLVASPNIENNSRRSTLKFDNTYYKEYVNLTLNIDQGGTSCIVISDDSITVPASTDHLKSTYPPAEVRLTLDDLPKRIDKTRESFVFNSTVASEVMYELKQQVSDAKKTCCSFQGNCNCRNRRTIAVVKRENVDTVRECWRQNLDRILESVSAVPSHDMPLDERINEILSRPMKPLPLSCLEKQTVHLPVTPTIWFLCDNYMKSLTLSDNPCDSYNPCDRPATPSVTALISNRLITEGYRWFLDSSDESQTHLYLRHSTLRTIQIKLLLQKPRRWYSKEEDIRIERLECTQCWQNTVRSPRLLAVHLEFMQIIDKMVLEQLCSRCPTTAHLMSLIVCLDSLVEQVFCKVDQLCRIVRNNGAVLERFGNTDQLRIYKVFEYEREAEVHWNRVSVQFETIDRIEHTSVAFHRKMEKAECLYPTEHQCGNVGVRGLVFLECLLWNIEKFSI